MLACFPVYADTVLRIESSAKAKNLRTGTETTVAVGDELTVADPTFIFSDEKIPVLVLPIDGAQRVKLDLPAYKTALPELHRKQFNASLSGVLIRVAEVQQKIREKKVAEAYESFSSLERDYAGLPFLGFLKASLELLRGNREEAVKLTRAALEAHPSYEEGKRFLEQLTGVPVQRGVASEEKSP